MNQHDIDRIRHSGPSTFAEVEIVQAHFEARAQLALTVAGADEIRTALAELNEWGRHLPVCSQFVMAEIKRRLRELPSRIDVGEAALLTGVVVTRRKEDGE